MVSLLRTIRSMRRVGLREWFRQMQYIGDAKSGRFVGMDEFGNRYFENMNAEEEIPGRHRWVDYAQHEYNGTQVPPTWHSWLSHIRLDPPTEDPIVQNVTPHWKAPHVENLTGTRGAFKTYNTTVPKINAWEPKVTPRGTSSL
ncbi:NDUFA12-domain-containing protein [Sistotremastrum niveocremeum HHB9708]|uniref:NADH dehydrogenase [ubiquinone] 1 alpha subcomplex subunit n=2 Tax=Sistotremastraceae TaxID=3402574 RepID=A0A164Z6N2_9AGAM|nr:NDUFA12-domain-containing protein [Sistotremastrum niveocremeum HHB9708]KZT39627.1 NDUFA12-domain-containing protein [Sistotremastrum suecicum HHB10207 ss-3]